MTDSAHNLTPAGRQVERALNGGYPVAAANLYTFNIRENVAMVEGDHVGEVSVWREWHRKIQARTGMDDEPVLGEMEASEEADALGLIGEDREDYIAARVDEFSETEPSIIKQTVRSPAGEVIGTELVSNPRLGQE
jgi:hypothetical protein